MHRTDGANHSSNMFEDRDLVTPLPGTQIEKAWLNSMQEELMSLLTDAGIAPVKGTWTQVRDSLRTLFVRATGTASQTITGVKTFTGRMISALAPGAGSANVSIQNTDTSADSQALDASSSSVGTAAKFRNTSTGRAAQFQSEDGCSTIRLVPLTNVPTGGADGDIAYVAGSLNMLYARINGVWTALA